MNTVAKNANRSIRCHARRASSSLMTEESSLVKTGVGLATDAPTATEVRRHPTHSGESPPERR